MSRCGMIDKFISAAMNIAAPASNTAEIVATDCAACGANPAAQFPTIGSSIK